MNVITEMEFKQKLVSPIKYYTEYYILNTGYIFTYYAHPNIYKFPIKVRSLLINGTKFFTLVKNSQYVQRAIAPFLLTMQLF